METYHIFLMHSLLNLRFRINQPTGRQHSSVPVQIPDSDPAGVVAACNGYLETFGIDDELVMIGTVESEKNFTTLYPEKGKKGGGTAAPPVV